MDDAGGRAVFRSVLRRRSVHHLRWRALLFYQHAPGERDIERGHRYLDEEKSGGKLERGGTPPGRQQRDQRMVPDGKQKWQSLFRFGTPRRKREMRSLLFKTRRWKIR